MKRVTSLLFLAFAVGCTKPQSDCSFPTFRCLQGNWNEKEHTDSTIQLKEYIQVYLENNREILYDWTDAAQLQTSQLPVGKYYFGELANQDSVALTPVWQGGTFHRYLKMINENEIEIDYLQQSPIFKKRYIRVNRPN